MRPFCGHMLVHHVLVGLRAVYGIFYDDVTDGLSFEFDQKFQKLKSQFDWRGRPPCHARKLDLFVCVLVRVRFPRVCRPSIHPDHFSIDRLIELVENRRLYYATYCTTKAVTIKTFWEHRAG